MEADESKKSHALIIEAGVVILILLVITIGVLFAITYQRPARVDLLDL